MAQKIENRELVSFKELLMANSNQVDAAIQLLIEKGFFTQDEFFLKLKTNWQKRQGKVQTRWNPLFIGGKKVLAMQVENQSHLNYCYH
jgi:hypothetical protein